MIEKNTCTVCKQRKAIYYRSESGEWFCSRCLEKSIIKRTIKCINKYNLLTPRDKIVYIALPTHNPYFTYLLRILLTIEKGYPTNITVLTIPNLVETIKVYGGIRNFNIETIEIELEYYNRDYDLRLFEEVKIISNNVPKEAKVVLPLVLDNIVKLYLLAIIRGNIDFLNYLRPMFNVRERFFITPFRFIPSKEIALAYYIRNPDEYVSLCEVSQFYKKSPLCSIVDQIINQIIRQHPETGFMLIDKIEDLYRLLCVSA